MMNENSELRRELESVEREYRRLVLDAQSLDAAVSRAFRAAGLPGWESPAPASQPAPVRPTPSAPTMVEDPIEEEDLADGFPVSAAVKRTEILSAAFCAHVGGDPGDLLTELGSFEGKDGRVPGRRTAREYAGRPRWLGVVHRKLVEAGVARGLFRVSGREVHLLDGTGRCVGVLRADGIVDALPVAPNGIGRKPC